MEIERLLKGVSCSCGKNHTCDIRFVFIEEDAEKHLEMICSDFDRLLLVADENTYAAAGRQTEDALAKKITKKVIFPGCEVLIPDEKAVSRVDGEADGCGMIVAIGSGVIQDLCKYVSFNRNIPYLIVATAPSMDGYASENAAMIMKGMKVSYTCHMPYAIVADTAVLAKAPMEMIRAGAGDIIGKYSALNDWELSRCVNDEYLCEFVYDETYEQVGKVIGLIDKILVRDKAAVGALMQALVIAGIMISFAGTSRPASGSEHHLSHFFEITGLVNGTKYFPHGIDVAYSTVVTAAIRKNILAKAFPGEAHLVGKDERNKQIKRIYGTSAKGCIELQEKTGNYDRDRMKKYTEKEKEIREILSKCPDPEEIKTLLSRLGLPMEDFYSMYPAGHIRDAVRYAKDLKDRYTVLWMNFDFNGGQEPEIDSL